MDFLEQRWRECDDVNDDGALLKLHQTSTLGTENILTLAASGCTNV